MPLNKQDALAAWRGTFPVLKPGHVWLAGAGPGDPGLLTLDALAGLAQADVVVHDALVDRRVLALAGSDATLEFAGKRGGAPRAATERGRPERVRARRRGSSGARRRRNPVPRHSRRHVGARRASRRL